MSKALESAKALETFNIIAPLPDTDIHKAEKTLLKKRGDDPDEWMKDDQTIIQEQQQAQQGQQGNNPQPSLDQNGQPIPVEGPPTDQANINQQQPGTLVPPSQLTSPGSSSGFGAQMSQALHPA